MNQIDWIAVDWGTTNLRVWAMSEQGEVITQRSDAGLGGGGLTRDQFEPALIGLIDDWLAPQGVMPVISCGMLGSREGLMDVGYRAVPCQVVCDPKSVTTLDPRIALHINRGMMQTSPSTLMRGEETQLVGLLSEFCNFSGAVCLPGTHSKWVEVADQQVLGFQSFLTGEHFALLSERSVLRHSVQSNTFDTMAFLQGVNDVLADSNQFATQLFAIRAESVLGQTSAEAARSRLSGLVIGSELVASRHYWSQYPVKLVGAQNLCAHYALALKSLGADVEQIDGTAVTVAGLYQTYLRLRTES